MASLLDMTDVPMKNILENCGFKSVLTLRKVCHSLRNFIDDARFKTDLDTIDITIDSTGFSVRCLSWNALSTKPISFAKDWTSSDLKIILKLVQNSKLTCFIVNHSPDSVRGLDDLEELLKNQTRPLQTESFAMEGSEILKVLPYLDPKTLKEICIFPIDFVSLSQNLDGIEKVMELEQFKNAVVLNISYCFLVRADLRKFFHFQKVDVSLHETSMEELVALKEAFVSSTHMEYFNFRGGGLDGNQLEQVFGTPFHNPHGGPQWFFEIQNCKEHVLSIEWFLGVLRFRKLQAKEVPQNAVAFVTSAHMQSFNLGDLKLNENQFEQVFGTPFHDPLRELDSSQWFFKMQSCKEYVLRIDWHLEQLTFWNWKATEVPQDAVVQH